MKKLAKILTCLIFCLSVTVATVTGVFAANVAQVKGVKASNVAYNSVTITWTKVSGATGYEVQQYKNKQWTNLKTVSTNSLAVSKLTTGTTYQFRVRAYKKNWIRTEYGSYSKTLSVKPMPAKVTNLKATNITPTTAKLTWSKVSGATGYYVQQYKSKKWVTVKNITSAKTTSYSLSKLSLGSSYKYRVIAYRTVSKKVYQGAASSTLTVKPAVPAPTSLKSSSLTSSSVKLTWGKVATATGYKVQVQNGKKWSTLKTITSNKTVTYTAKIVPGTTYKYRVLAYKTVGKKQYDSAASSTLTVKYTVPAAKSLKTSSLTSSSVKLSWTAASGVKGYKVQQANGSSWKDIATVTTNSYTAKIVPGTSYQFRVVSYVTVGGKNYSAAASNTVTAKYNIVAAGGLKVASTTSSKANLTWTAASGASGYKVQRLNGSTWNDIATVKETAYSADIMPQTDYKFRVVAFVTVNGTDYRAAASNEVSAKYEISAPGTLKVTDATTDSVSLSWTAAAKANGYQLYIAQNGTWTLAGETTATSFTVGGLTQGTEYNFKVCAFETIASKKYLSEFSNIVAGQVTLPAPSGLTLSSISKNSANISWTAVKGAEGYNIYVSENGAEWKKNKTVASASASITGLNGSSTYKIAVTAFHSTNGYTADSAKSNELSVSVNADKKALTLKVMQALNNSKKENSEQPVKVTSLEKTDAEVKDGRIKFGLLNLSLEEALKRFGLEEELDSLTADLKEETKYECTFTYGYGTYEKDVTVYVKDQDGNYVLDENGNRKTQVVTRKFGATPLTFISPKNKYVALPDENNLTAIGNAISSVTYSQANGKETVVLTLSPETVATSNTTTSPYHDCFVDNVMEALGDSGDTGTITAKLGNSVSVNNQNIAATTVKAIINENGTLDSYEVVVPFKLHMDASVSEGSDFLSLSMDIDVYASTSYVFER